MSILARLDSPELVLRLAPAARLKRHWRVKVAMAFSLNAFALVPYYLLQTYPQFAVATMPVTTLDDWIPFDDRLVGLYLSLFLLTAVAPVQMGRGEQLRRYTAGVIVMSLLADLVFFLWPTTIVRPETAAANVVYENLTRLVRPHNACPSLHAAMAVFSALCYEQIAPQARAAPWWRVGIWLWALGVIYATLAIKEHVALDALAGILLGASAYLWAFRSKIAYRPVTR